MFPQEVSGAKVGANITPGGRITVKLPFLKAEHFELDKKREEIALIVCVTQLHTKSKARLKTFYSCLCVLVFSIHFSEWVETILAHMYRR